MNTSMYLNPQDKKYVLLASRRVSLLHSVMLEQ